MYRCSIEFIFKNCETELQKNKILHCALCVKRIAGVWEKQNRFQITLLFGRNVAFFLNVNTKIV